MVLTERQLSILKRIMTSPDPVQVKDLSEIENVSLQTIYNDLKIIENIRFSVNRGKVGFVLDEYENPSISHKIYENRSLREKACDYVIEIILSSRLRGTLFIDGGSTGYIFFERLLQKTVHDLTIITNNPLVIGSALNNQDFFAQNSIFAMGGKLDATRLSLYSLNHRTSFSCNMNELPAIDICILGFRAISSDGDLFIGNEEEIHQKKSLVGKSRQLILIASPDKLGTTSLFKITSLPKEIKTKNRQIIIITGIDDSLNPEASAALHRLIEVLGESSVKIVN